MSHDSITSLPNGTETASTPDGESSIARKAFEIGIDDKVAVKDAVLIGLQHIFVMVGIFVFPGIMGASFNLPVEATAHLYGATFVGCGVTTLLMCMCFGRMPLVAGSYAGVFAVLITLGHLSNSSLGVAFGSLLAASLLWCVLAIPIRGISFVSLAVGKLKSPLISGSIIMLVMMQITYLALPHWLGKPGQPSFPSVNFGAGLVTALLLMIFTVSRWPTLRRLALLLSLVAGSIVFEIFCRIDFTPLAKARWFVAPTFFPFGIAFNPEFCLVFFIILGAVNIQTTTLMEVVGKWDNQEISASRLSKGVLSMMLGSAIASTMGGFTSIPFPANIALLKSTGVASRYVALATSVILILMGFCTKIDYIFVLMPVPVLAATATVLFGIVFVHGVEMFSQVKWNNRSLTITGFSLMVGFGSLFLEKPTLAGLPFFASLLLGQPVIVGVTSLVLLNVILPGRSDARVVKKTKEAVGPDRLHKEASARA